MYLVVFSYFGEFPKIALQIVLLTQEDFFFTGSVHDEL